jgi:hypothetical protein
MAALAGAGPPPPPPPAGPAYYIPPGIRAIAGGGAAALVHMPLIPQVAAGGPAGGGLGIMAPQPPRQVLPVGLAAFNPPAAAVLPVGLAAFNPPVAAVQPDKKRKRNGNINRAPKMSPNQLQEKANLGIINMNKRNKSRKYKRKYTRKNRSRKSRR